ncbi:glycosyltransferase family 90 protein [Thermothelomyces heterothallicus CBS 202.75]|uniref:glycosyltransferase family 90 protein n=1 Tax=Thermothelomyces heterothallicus CBS 202.75 TaxID=1149848 RepID=UPI0037425F32
MANQLTALSAVTSFAWLAHSVEDHQVIEQPRPSSLLVLLIGALSSYGACFFSVCLPGTNGRFDDERAPLRARRSNLPKKPRRYFLPALVVCIILRLEIFHRVSLDLQCSKQGIEAFLPLLIFLYEFLPGRGPPSGVGDDDREAHDFGMTVYEALGSWFCESKASLTLAVTMLTVGTYLVSSNDPRSTFFCSSKDASASVVFLQWVGLLLDTAIIIVAWRILAWTRTTKSRLRTLSGILLFAAVGTGLLYQFSRLVLPDTPARYDFRRLDSLYLFDVVVDGLAFSIFVISTSLLATESSPLSLVGLFTFLLGFTQAVRKTALTGTWENVAPGVVYAGLMLVCVGFSSLLYTNDIRSIAFLHRAFIVLLLLVVTIVATIYTPVKALRITEKHPLTKIMYDARTEADRWLVNAAVSDSLRVAVEEYKDRHHGRDPPAKFDVWYGFAKDRNSVVLDHFPQIEKDLLPFWGMAPSKIREGVRRAAAEPGMAILQIQNGKPRHNLPPSSPYKPVMEDLVELVTTFAEHLPDMELAINLNERPRVLAPWEDVQRLSKTATRKGVSKLLPKAANPLGELPAAQPAAESPKLSNPDGFTTSVEAYREMTALACPPGSRGRAGTHWDVRDVCTSCARPQSLGQYLTNWPLSQDICHQPDLFRLHGFHMTPPPLRPLQELLPVFSRAKTGVYSDILIPLRRISEPPEPRTEGFKVKYKRLFWRGKVDRHDTSHELARGGHQERLVHMLNNPSRSETTRILLPTKDRFMFEQVPTADINELFPMDVAFSSYTACKDSGDDETDNKNKQKISDNKESCKAISAEFHINTDEPPADDPLRHKYVMVIDTDDGPAPEFLRTLRSNSVPFYSSIFREWYSERLMPWIHFVPIDVRYHALHGTMAYFFGLVKRDGRTLNGREVLMYPRQDDAQWIAEQGKRWAEKAIRREDMEVYLFRLLLEWGRVIDDNRDEIGFVLT